MMSSNLFSNSEAIKFVSCRVGLEISDYTEQIDTTLKKYNIAGLSRREEPVQKEYAESNDFYHDWTPKSSWGNFIVVPITSQRFNYFETSNNEILSQRLLPDLVLKTQRWESEVAVSLGYVPLSSETDTFAMERFDKLLRHALYLPTRVIICELPPTKSGQRAMASIINECLKLNNTHRLILIRVSASLIHQASSQDSTKPDWLPAAPDLGPMETNLSPSDGFTSDGSGSHNSSQISEKLATKYDHGELLPGGWEAWNHIRSCLIPDHRIGVCLTINKESIEIEDTYRWQGEPVRMVTLSTARFAVSPQSKASLRPAGSIKEFLKAITMSNSLLTSFVIQLKPDCDIQEYLRSLSNLCDALDAHHPDMYRPWNDMLLDPLQPLANNLDSTTYNVFELDLVKYNKYGEAFLEALSCLLRRQENRSRGKEFVLMVLGAGRGPLVDAMITAIHKFNLKGRYKFKLYALDKNYSSIVSLRYKKAYYWNEFAPDIETVIVEADMRVWMPQEKADIIATELLGSFSDNELSPECIDGTWRFATSQTICIPQSYSSYLAPISSHRMRQELYKNARAGDQHCFDKLQVTRMRNYYSIAKPQRLFTFEHKRVNIQPKEGNNRREEILTFQATAETVCHGFAGYFEANLYGSVDISIVPGVETLSMESWFPVYIPLEEPIQMPPKTRLAVKFSRKETKERVWYEWQVLEPCQSRIHNEGGLSASMSKFI